MAVLISTTDDHSCGVPSPSQRCVVRFSFGRTAINLSSNLSDLRVYRLLGVAELENLLCFVQRRLA